MAQKTDELQNSFSRGVIDPLLWERIDLEHYYLGLKQGLNCICIPQGGLQRRPGLINKSRTRRRLAPVPFTSSMVTAHNGGNAANLADQDPATLFTTNTVSAIPFVLAEVDFATPQNICFIDVIGFSCQANGADRCLVAEYWTGSAWAAMPGSGDPTLSFARGISTSSRTRRFAGPPGFVAISQNFRLTIYPQTSIYASSLFPSLGTVSIGGLGFWQETAQLSKARLIPFAKEAQEVFQAVLTDRNVDCFQNGVWYGAAPVAIGNEIVRQAKWEQSLDTLILFHQDAQPPWVQRQGASDEWGVYYQTWSNLPNLTASTAFSGNANEVQQLNFSGLAVGDTFVFALGDKLTSVLTFSTVAQLVTDLTAALGSLYGVTGAGVVMTILQASPPQISVAFVDANGSRRWPPLSFIPMPDCIGSCVTQIIQKGVNATGPIMDETTGWPNCGLVHQSRFMAAGFRSAPSTWLMSGAGALNDFTLTGSPETADMGIQGTIDSDDVEEILHLFIGTRLHLFTTRAEWWSDNTTFSATATTDIILATRYGTAPYVLPVFVQNGTLLVQDGGQYGALANTVVRDFVYDWQINNYTSDPLSLLGGQLFSDITSMAHLQGVTTKTASLVFFVNADGSFAIMTLLKSQDITALMPASTQGAMIDVGVDLLRNAWAIVQRTDINGQPDNYLELFDGGTYLDAAVSFPCPAASVTLPEHLAGQTVWAFIDGDIYGPLAPDGAALTLPVIAQNSCVVGFQIDVVIEGLPWRPNPKQSMPARKKLRIYEAELSLIDSAPLQFSANDGAFQDVNLRYFDGAPLPQEQTGEEPANDWIGVPLLQRLYSGYWKIEGLDGWTRFARWRIQQSQPGPFTIRSINLKIAY